MLGTKGKSRTPSLYEYLLKDLLKIGSGPDTGLGCTDCSFRDPPLDTSSVSLLIDRPKLPEDLHSKTMIKCSIEEKERKKERNNERNKERKKERKKVRKKERKKERK